MTNAADEPGGGAPPRPRGLRGRGSQRVEQETIQIQVVDDFTSPPTPTGGPKPHPPVRRTTPLGEIQSPVGTLLVPSYLLQGLSLDESWADERGVAKLTYTSDDTILIIEQRCPDVGQVQGRPTTRRWIVVRGGDLP